ncbi:hypothetical protein HID58_038108 [Brassica napus]|uniref:Uncharacterized protein n=1 Tax=Brassica napus TaxID=3708 RepID=A0ABQ8BN72_BRANA|nr:hypothetical protein HID58_038108 [Brassica napus]
MANQTAVTTTQAPSLLFFSKVSLGPGDSQLLFKLIHFWEARNNSKGGILLGFEMLMIDEEIHSMRSPQPPCSSSQLHVRPNKELRTARHGRNYQGTHKTRGTGSDVREPHELAITVLRSSKKKVIFIHFLLQS